MKKIITIAREYGAGGRSVGKKVAEELGIAFYDRDLIAKTAQQSGIISADEVRKWEEKVPSEIGTLRSFFNFYEKPIDEQLWKSQVEVIRNIADHESCVIVGRNADYILREFDHVLKVFIHANERWRVKHMLEINPESDEDKVRKEMRIADKARENYCSKFTGQVYGKSDNYNLTIDTGFFSFDEAAKMIVRAAEKI